MLQALEYVSGIYALSIIVTLVVWLVIVAIRWVSSERTKPIRSSADLKRSALQ